MMHSPKIDHLNGEWQIALVRSNAYGAEPQTLVLGKVRSKRIMIKIFIALCGPESHE